MVAAFWHKTVGCLWLQSGPVFAHGTTRAKLTVGAPPPPQYVKICKKMRSFANYDSKEFIELTVGASHVLMSKAATNNICSNKHKE
jgi:hypothetical protein